jgi:hypothetical protein
MMREPQALLDDVYVAFARLSLFDSIPLQLLPAQLYKPEHGWLQGHPVQLTLRLAGMRAMNPT